MKEKEYVQHITWRRYDGSPESLPVRNECEILVAYDGDSHMAQYKKFDDGVIILAIGHGYETARIENEADCGWWWAYKPSIKGIPD